MKNFYSNGKLLLTGEYLVLDGALALAIPTSYGQSLTINTSNNDNKLIWKSLDSSDEIWFEDTFLIDNGILRYTKNDNEISKRLIEILNTANRLNSNFLKEFSTLSVEAKLDFPKDWGLGSSSTLINNIAQWANIDAYKLLDLTFGGSGYDIACAQHNSAITYQLIKQDEILNRVQNNRRRITQVDFNPSFSENLYFVYLNKKQNSRDGIKKYKSNNKNINLEVSEISAITEDILNCNNLETFNSLINVHEKIIGSVIKEQPVKQRLFSDFNGSIKSLGAWGGDFILVSSLENPSLYFKKKGYETIIPYSKMVLKQ